MGTQPARRVPRHAQRTLARCLGAALLAPLAAGCFAMRSDVARLQQQLAEEHQAAVSRDSASAAALGEVQRMLRGVRDSVAAQQAALTQMRGDVRVDLTNVQEQLVAIQELTGQSQQRLTELRGDLAQRSDASPTAAAPPAAGAPAPAAAAAASGDPSADQLYDLSLQQLRRGSPGAARSGFAELLRRYPSYARAADAVFFTGEAWEADHRSDSAAAAYRTVIQRWPASGRAASSLYRLGLQALAAGRTAEARDTFTRVVAQYPSAEEAALARERLRTLPATR
jgi:tol-pal system protein YbgF